MLSLLHALEAEPAAHAALALWCAPRCEASAISQLAAALGRGRRLARNHPSQVRIQLMERSFPPRESLPLVTHPGTAEAVREVVVVRISGDQEGAPLRLATAWSAALGFTASQPTYIEDLDTGEIFDSLSWGLFRVGALQPAAWQHLLALRQDGAMTVTVGLRRLGLPELRVPSSEDHRQGALLVWAAASLATQGSASPLSLSLDGLPEPTAQWLRAQAWTPERRGTTRPASLQADVELRPEGDALLLVAKDWESCLDQLFGEGDPERAPPWQGAPDAPTLSGVGDFGNGWSGRTI